MYLLVLQNVRMGHGRQRWIPPTATGDHDGFEADVLDAAYIKNFVFVFCAVDSITRILRRPDACAGVCVNRRLVHGPIRWQCRGPEI